MGGVASISKVAMRNVGEFDESVTGASAAFDQTPAMKRMQTAVSNRGNMKCAQSTYRNSFALSKAWQRSVRACNSGAGLGTGLVLSSCFGSTFFSSAPLKYATCPERKSSAP